MNKKTTYRQCRQLIENNNDYLKVKYYIVDNVDKLSEKEKQEIYKLYAKKYGENELWWLLRGIYKITPTEIG